MDELLAILTEVEEMFLVAKQCPHSELALSLWEIENSWNQQLWFAEHGNRDWFAMHENIETAAYNQLAHLGYVPLEL